MAAKDARSGEYEPGQQLQLGDFTTDGSQGRKELKKAVEAIHISAGKLSLLQKKILNFLVYYAYPELPSTQVHTTSQSALSKDVGFDSKNVEFLKKAMRGILDVKVEFNVLGKNGVPGWRASAFLAEVEISDGLIRYSFPPQLRKELHNPKIFSLINLHIIRKFNSSYALSLYENVFRFKNVGSTGYVSIGDWKILLGVDEAIYDDFKYFNRDVLKPAIAEVNKLTDIHIEPDFQMQGRKTIGLRFAITEQELHIPADPGRLFDEYREEDLLARIVALGVSEKTARGYLSKHPLDYIAGNLDVVEERIRGGKVKNYPALFRNALTEDYRPFVATIDHNIAAQRQADEDRRKAAAEVAAEQANQATQAVRDRLDAARKYYDELSPTDKKRAEKDFAESIKGNAPIYKQYRTSGLDSKFVRSAFDNWLSDLMGHVTQG